MLPVLRRSTSQIKNINAFLNLLPKNVRCFCEKVREDDVRKKILESSLPFVHELGWSREAIAAGAESLGFSSSIRGLFENDGFSLVQYFQQTCNNNLINQLNSRKSEGVIHTDEWNETQTALELRLRMITPMIDKWPEAMALLARPNHIPDSLKLLTDMADDIAYHSAKTHDLDMSWYTRRVFISGVYLAGELSLVQDKSTDFIQTWDLLAKLIKNRHKAEILTQQLVNSGANLTLFSSALFQTAKNILGLGSFSR